MPTRPVVGIGPPRAWPHLRERAVPPAQNQPQPGEAADQRKTPSDQDAIGIPSEQDRDDDPREHRARGQSDNNRQQEDQCGWSRWVRRQSVTVPPGMGPPIQTWTRQQRGLRRLSLLGQPRRDPSVMIQTMDEPVPVRRQRRMRRVAQSTVHSAVAAGIAALLVLVTGIAAWVAALLAAFILVIGVLARERL